MLTAPAIQNFKDTLFEAPEHGKPPEVFAILDGAGVRRLPDLLEDEDLEHACLFTGETDPIILIRAPWLVKLTRDSAITEVLLTEGWKQNWGIFTVCPHGADFEDVLDHFREFIQVRLPDARLVFFRFYDPRVWRQFLPSCDATQAGQLFDLPGAFACEAEDGVSLIVDTLRDGLPYRRTVDLFSSAPSIPALEPVRP